MKISLISPISVYCSLISYGKEASDCRRCHYWDYCGVSSRHVCLSVFPAGKLIFTIQFDEANKLKTGDFMYVKGLKIGEVKSIRLDNVQRLIVTEVLLYARQELPDDSFFFIWPDQLVTGSKCIQIKLGASPNMIQRGDTLKGGSSMLDIISNTGVDWLKSGGLWLESMEEEIKNSGT